MRITAGMMPVFSDSDPAQLARGYQVKVRIEWDDTAGNPWDNEEGHGAVSKWRPRDSKGPGEMVLVDDRGRCLFYDFAGAVATARKDGWDSPPYNTGTKGERAHRAALADFERLRGFCRGDWGYVGVIVTVTRAGAEVGRESLWRVESEGDYWRQVAAELAEEIIAPDCQARDCQAREKRLRHAMPEEFFIDGTVAA
jgi:hypothetical protein